MLEDVAAAFDWGPDGPGTPFAGPLFWIIDTVRIATCLLAVVVVWQSMSAALDRTVRAHQTARFFALAAFALSAATTEIDHFGDAASPRLLLHIVGCAAALYGLTRFHQRHSERLSD